MVSICYADPLSMFCGYDRNRWLLDKGILETSQVALNFD